MVRELAAGGQDAERSHKTAGRKKELEVGWDYKLPKPSPTTTSTTSSRKTPPPKVSIVFSNSVTMYMSLLCTFLMQTIEGRVW